MYQRNLKIKQLVLMAGGRGTRMGDLSKKIPKCLVKINKKELIRYHIEFAHKNNFKEILILTGYKHKMVKEFIKNIKVKGLRIKLIKDKKESGTGSAIFSNLRLFEKNFLLIYADLYHNLNLEDFLLFHKSKKSDLSLVINKNDHPRESNLISIDKKKKVKKIYYYPHTKLIKNLLYTNEAIFLVNRSSLKGKIVKEAAKDPLCA